MRTLALLPLAVALVACAGSRRVTTTATTRNNPAERSASNPTGEEQEYSTSISLNDSAAPPVSVAEPGPAVLASDGSGYHWVVAEEGGYVRALGRDVRWQAPVYEVSPPSANAVKAGDRLFVARVPPGRPPSYAVWEVGSVERLDPGFGKVYVGGKLYDLAREVLVPREPLPENTPAR